MQTFLRSVPVFFLALLFSHSVVESSVVINEIMNDPVAVSDSYGEWLELHNTGDDTLELNGWSISDSSRDFHEFFLDGGLLLPPGSYFVLGREADPSINGGYTPDYEYNGFTLSNSEDEIMLFDDDSLLVDSVIYGGEGWPSGSGQSLEFIEGSADNSDGANWAMATDTYGDGDYGTPGKKNSASTVGFGESGTGQEEVDDPVLFLKNYPNPFGSSTTITFEGVKERVGDNYQHLKRGPALVLKVYDLRGRLVRDLWEGDLDRRVTLTWDGRDNKGALISPGLYILQLAGKEASCQRKIVFQGR
jgi:hypothetical protein